MSDSVRPHRRQPTRLPHPWESPGKNAGVGCHFLFQCMKVKSESADVQLCSTLSDPVDCSPPGSPIPGIPQARTLEWVPLPSPSEPIRAQQTSVFYSHTVLLIHVNRNYLFAWKPALLQDSGQLFNGPGWLTWCQCYLKMCVAGEGPGATF